MKTKCRAGVNSEKHRTFAEPSQPIYHRIPKSASIAILAGLLALGVAWGYYSNAPLGQSDLDQLWVAARALLHGHDPYDAVLSAHAAREYPLYYPLTAVLLTLPLAPLPLVAARLAWTVGGALVFGYAIGKYRPYLWPTLMGMPFLVALRSGQWSPLLTAAMLIPALGWLGAGKPNLGLAMLAGSRTKEAATTLVLGGFTLLLVSVIVSPSWPWEWRRALAGAAHFRPLLLRPGGFLLLLGLLRWRDPDARLLVALSLVPTTGLFYDVLPACLVARTRMQAATLALLSLGAKAADPLLPTFPDFAALTWANGTLVVWTVLLPALSLVLWRDRRGIFLK